MNKIIKLLFLLCLTIFFLAGNSMAIPLTTVGNVDNLLAYTDLSNSGDSVELAWVNSVLGPDYTAFSHYDDNIIANDWQNVTGTDLYAYALPDGCDYVLIKIGNGASAHTFDNNHFLYENLSAFDWLVININNLANTSGEETPMSLSNIDVVSHIAAVGANPVPEPATLLLLGLGLVGLAGISRKRKQT